MEGVAAMAEIVRIPCKISRSAFSDERVFRVASADGAEHIGAATVIYFSKGDGSPLGPKDPPADKPIWGQVAAQSIKGFQDTVLVYLPDGEVVHVKSSQIREEASANVPVES
jgi:hypothetical protein